MFRGLGTISDELQKGLNRFHVYKTLALGSAAVNIYTSYSVRVKEFELINAFKQ